MASTARPADHRPWGRFLGGGLLLLVMAVCASAAVASLHAYQFPALTVLLVAGWAATLSALGLRQLVQLLRAAHAA